MASDSARSTAEYVTDTSGSSVQIVAPVVDLMGGATASSGGPPSHTSALSAPVVSVRSSSGRGQDSSKLLIRSRTLSPCRARASARHMGSHHPMMKKQLRPGWTRLSPHRRWRTSAWHASAPRSAAPARRVLPRLRKRCRRRLDSWDPSFGPGARPSTSTS